MPGLDVPELAASGLAAALVEDIHSGSLTLPVMPEVAVRLRSAADDPAVSARKLGELVGADPALAARVLKMANSALYAGLDEIRALDRAIGRLGSAMVVALAVGAASKESFRSEDRGFNRLLGETWRRSLFAAALCRLLAEQAGIEQEEAFLGGLLHASGEPVLLDLILRKLASGGFSRPDDGELRALIDALAPSAAARLLRSWQLPERLVATVEHQAEPARAEPEFRTGCRLVALAARFGRLVGSGHEAGELARDPLLGELAFEPPAAAELLARGVAEGLEIAGAF